MPKFLLLDTRRGVHHTGDNLADVVRATGAICFDFAYRRIGVYGVSDTATFSDEWSHDELVREMASERLRCSSGTDFNCSAATTIRGTDTAVTIMYQVLHDLRDLLVDHQTREFKEH